MSREIGRRVGGLTTSARYSSAMGRKSVASRLARFEEEADPDGTLPEAERRRRGELLMRAHMLRLAAKSAASRRAASASKVEAVRSDPRCA